MHNKRLYRSKNTTRLVLIITKYYSFIDGTLELEEEEFEDVKSGISSFVNNPTGVNIILKKMHITSYF